MYKVRKYLSDIFLLMSLAVIGTTCIYVSKTENNTQEAIANPIVSIEEAPTYKYGYDVAKHTFEKYHIKQNAFMSDILMDHGIDFDQILKLEREAKDIFSLRKIKAGKDITFVKDDPCEAPKSFIYRPNKLDYVVYEFGENVDVCSRRLPYEVKVETASGMVEYTLGNSMLDLGLSLNLIDKMEDALAQVNFIAAQKGDRFKLIFERIYVDNEPIGTGQVLSAAYKTGANEYFGFYYENDRYKGYYDFDGTPNKKTFLNAPVRASRISSGFSRNRFHPVLKRRKAHLGTDYAAPTGTPIMAVANGVVTARSFTKGNGNYVKVKHDKVYATQYLHMSRFAKGIKVGTPVNQGQVIGYVGQTGLATGPHVCFRFWKNGKQVNHRTENFPPLNPMDDSELPSFYKVRNDLIASLRDVKYRDPAVSFATVAE